MARIEIPAFGESEFSKNAENNSSTVVVIPQATAENFSAYCDLLTENGFEAKEFRNTDHQLYAGYFDGERGVFLNFFESVAELYIVTEENCKYFSYTDTPADSLSAPQITQMSLEDYGLSYVVRLSDGRFIIIDGGRDFDVDRDKLYKHLKVSTPHEKPVIAAWVLTHPHSDHFHLFVGFSESYGDDVIVEKVIYNFPEPDDTAHYPKLVVTDKRFDYDISGTVWIPKMRECIEKLGATVYTAHTGQIYRIGDAVCEILACMDDTIHLSDNINATSVIFRMELAGQTVLWSADGAYSIAKLPEKYGEYLKSDILQVPHHGFQSGSWEAEVEGYKLIKPRVCLLPVSDYNAYIAFSAHMGGTHFLMTSAGIEEMITGGTHTIILPYTPPESAKAELERKYFAGQDACGARTWIFTELNTSKPEDFEFMFLNGTHKKAVVWIELFFEDSSRKIRNIKAEVPPTAMKRLSIVVDVDDDAVYFDYLSLKKQGIPENVPFAARFICDVPIVVSHKIHKATYYSQNR